MVMLHEAIAKIDEYCRSIRHPTLPDLQISPKYELFPKSKPNSSDIPAWPNRYPFSDKQGIYLILSRDDRLLYVGKASMNSCISSRLSSYFEYEPISRRCQVRNLDKWSESPHYIVTVAVPDSSSFEAPAIEEYLIKNYSKDLPDNTIGTK